MVVSFRDAVIMLHEWIAVLLLALAVVPFGLRSVTNSEHRLTVREYQVFGGYLVAIAGLAWASVLIGAYLAYPFYRAKPPAGLLDLSGFPQRLLMSNPATLEWHGIGMEWKEHIAWFAPITLTAAASIFLRYGARLAQLRALRNAVVSFAILAFVSAGVAGLAGAMIYKYAPVRSPHVGAHGENHG